MTAPVFMHMTVHVPVSVLMHMTVPVPAAPDPSARPCRPPQAPVPQPPRMQIPRRRSPPRPSPPSSWRPCRPGRQPPPWASAPPGEPRSTAAWPTWGGPRRAGTVRGPASRSTHALTIHACATVYVTATPPLLLAALSASRAACSAVAALLRGAPDASPDAVRSVAAALSSALGLPVDPALQHTAVARVFSPLDPTLRCDAACLPSSTPCTLLSTFTHTPSLFTPQVAQPPRPASQ